LQNEAVYCTNSANVACGIGCRICLSECIILALPEVRMDPFEEKFKISKRKIRKNTSIALKLK
jgi:hypothetical protein